MKIRILFGLFLIHIVLAQPKAKQKSAVFDDISEHKDLKKILRTKNNVIILYTSNPKESQGVIKLLDDVAQIVKGEATALLIDCSLSSDTKKLCRKMKANPEPTILRHYKDGAFNKDYERQLAVSSLVNFLRDPTGDIPWEEDDTSTDIVHLRDTEAMMNFFKKEVRPVLIMFYAPWCGYCKKMKPDFSAAASELKPDYVLGAMDVNRPENARIRRLFNITGFPTLIYFEDGELRYNYEGENTVEAIVEFMKNPSAPVNRETETDWTEDIHSETVHLMTGNFHKVLKDEKSALVIFHAPWCGHCKRIRGEYEKAAVIMRQLKFPGVLAAVDATKEPDIAKEFKIKSYPTLKYFSLGAFKFDINVRDSEKIVEFMKNPVEPPTPPPERQWEDEKSYVVHLNDSNFKTYLRKRKHALVMFYAPWCGHCKRAKPEFTIAADTFKDDPRVGLAAVDCTQYKSVCSTYDIKGFPTFKYFSYLKTHREYTGGRSADDFENFLHDPDAPIPKVEDFGKYPGSDSLLELTDDNFYETFKKIDNLLVMFYAPWCGHCTKLKPQFSEASQRVSNDKIGALGILDATIHKKIAGDFNIKGYPTLKLFQKGTFKVEYSGSRTVDDIYEFMKSKVVKDEL